MRQSNRSASISRVLTTLTTLTMLVACASGETASDAASADEVARGSYATPEAGTPPAAAPVLTPSARFALADDERVGGVAMSPDGSRIVVKTQAKLGAPVTLRAYDATTGAPGPSVTINSVGLWTLHWMADNRLVAADRDAQLRWRVWDGTTLAEQAALSQDATCADGGIADRVTGAVYSTNGISGMGDVICRFDTNCPARRGVIGCADHKPHQP